MHTYPAPHHYIPGVPVYFVYPPVPLISSPSTPPTSSSSPSPSYAPTAIPYHSAGVRTPRLRIVPLPDVNDDSRRSGSGHRRAPHNPQPSRELPLYPDRPSINALLAQIHRSDGTTPLHWDLMYEPSTALPENPSCFQTDLRRSALRASARDGGDLLQSLVLMFPLLRMQIVVTPSRSSYSSPQYVTVWDVLDGLYRGLRAPVEPHEFVRLSESEQATLLRAAEMRSGCIPEDAHSRDALRRIDYLAKRRWFLGLRPARPIELPRGKRLGEVFIVEVGMGDR